jgi:hypothetical protein
MLGADTSSFHNFGAETIAKTGGNWTTLNFVPLIRLVCDPEGIEEVGNHSLVRVFPNPAKGDIFLENAGSSKIEIYDITGNLVITDNQLSSSRKLDISNLTSGVYLLRIIGKDKIERMKIIIE